jgi:hypothetical protein
MLGISRVAAQLVASGVVLSSIESVTYLVPTNTICMPHLPHACYMPFQFHPHALHHSQYIWRGVKVMKLLITHFSRASFLFGPKMSQYNIPLLAESYSFIYSSSSSDDAKKNLLAVDMLRRNPC